MAKANPAAPADEAPVSNEQAAEPVGTPPAGGSWKWQGGQWVPAASADE